MANCAPRLVSGSKETLRLMVNVARNMYVVQNVATLTVLVLLGATEAGGEQDVVAD